jgi:hypothetical protein
VFIVAFCLRKSKSYSRQNSRQNRKNTRLEKIENSFNVDLSKSKNGLPGKTEEVIIAVAFVKLCHIENTFC